MERRPEQRAILVYHIRLADIAANVWGGQEKKRKL
jgi:hypothetical protein